MDGDREAGLERMRQEHRKPVLAEWDLEVVVWDGARAHRGKSLADLTTTRFLLPPYSPERTPTERVLEESRRRVEGTSLTRSLRSRPSSRTTCANLPPILSARSLCGYQWLCAALERLPVAS